jgi:oxalate decarboxylase/phosphoglucose isomerase-like protein (cupin superfamily)
MGREAMHVHVWCGGGEARSALQKASGFVGTDRPGDMTPGDVVLVPSWCWHGYANEGKSTSV